MMDVQVEDAEKLEYWLSGTHAIKKKPGTANVTAVERNEIVAKFLEYASTCGRSSLPPSRSPSLSLFCCPPLLSPPFLSSSL